MSAIQWVSKTVKSGASKALKDLGTWFNMYCYTCAAEKAHKAWEDRDGNKHPFCSKCGNPN
jgi:NAD-dependent SIR2 family protein deacetylase